MASTVIQNGIRPFSRYISIGARARTRSCQSCSAKWHGIHNPRWGSSVSARRVEEEEDLVEDITQGRGYTFDVDRSVDMQVKDDRSTEYDSSVVRRDFNVKDNESASCSRIKQGQAPTTAEHYYQDAVSIESLVPDTPARNLALLTIEAIRSKSPLADDLSVHHMEVIMSQLYGEDATLEFRKEHTNRENTRSLRYSLALLSQLQATRRPRNTRTYEILLKHCVHVNKPDMAASVYAGLVEEWILEGRVAEVGNKSLFGEGGVPKVDTDHVAETDQQLDDQAKDNEKTKQIIDSWFEGVRTWRLPGETMAPLEKLRLWHPKALRLQEKMRNFPLPSPTSPPSLVPAPDSTLLDIVICSLTYEPKVQSPTKGKSRDPATSIQNREYRRSARALAILANTILSRTLPVTALRPLFKAMRRLSLALPVYPKNLDLSQIPRNQLSEYSAGTHVHSALVSLMWSPPSLNFPSATWSAYRLPPLSLQSTRSLLKYALRAFPTSGTIKRFLSHIKNTFGIGIIAKTIPDIPLAKAEAWKTFFRVNKIDDQLKELEANQYDEEIPEPPIKDEDIIFRLKLAHNSSRSEVTRIVFHAFPFLDVRSYPSIEPGSEYAELHREQHRRTRLVKRALNRSPWVYVACLSVLGNMGSTSLAERLYTLSLRAENKATEDARLGKSGSKTWYLPIEAHVCMLRLYLAEYREAKRRQELQERQFDTRIMAAQQFRGLRQDPSHGRFVGVPDHVEPGRRAFYSCGFILNRVLVNLEESYPSEPVHSEDTSPGFDWTISRPPIPNEAFIQPLADIATEETKYWVEHADKSVDKAKRVRNLVESAIKTCDKYGIKQPRSLQTTLNALSRRTM